MQPATPATPATPAGPPAPEAEAFVRFCYQRRRVGWPELYDEMCHVAMRGLFRGMGTDALADVGVGFSLFETPRLAALVARIGGGGQAAPRAPRRGGAGRARARARDRRRPIDRGRAVWHGARGGRGLTPLGGQARIRRLAISPSI